MHVFSKQTLIVDTAALPLEPHIPGSVRVICVHCDGMFQVVKDQILYNRLRIGHTRLAHFLSYWTWTHKLWFKNRTPVIFAIIFYKY